ncbi:MAG TPA: protein kinase [Pyrinomonadaceae bacterium]|nr:protein kinase [Pyrinomonadaceae bacterium]
MPATNELLQEGRYRVSHPISQDGTVFEAYDTVRNTTVLVREFPVRMNRVTTVSQQESIKLAFASQAKALSEIEHESLIHVEDYFSDFDRQFLVMESVEGEDLSELLKQNRKAFSVGEVVRWADQILDALDCIHSRKPAVIHRNIRPENVRLHTSGKVKLLGVSLDDGIDIELNGNSSEACDLRYSPMEQIWPGLDAASQKVITNSYDDRSERILKEPLDARSDIYALGATLYLLMTGREPVDPLERSIDILEGKLDPLREPTKVDGAIPAEISDVLMKALEIKRENRYDSAVIMRQVLKAAVTRVEEREAADAGEHEEGAELLRMAAQPKTADARETVDAEKRRQKKLEQERPRQLEQKRLGDEQAGGEREAAERAKAERREAERRVAAEKAEGGRLEAEPVTAEHTEAERPAREAKEVAQLGEEEEAPVAESLLEIPVSAEVMAYRDAAPDVDENELAAVLDELEKAELEAEQNSAPQTGETKVREVAESVEADVETEPEQLQVFETAGDSDPETTDAQPELFSETEKAGFSLPIPAIAGAAGLLVVIVVGAWMMMSGGSEPASQPQPAAVEVAQPVDPAPSAPVDTTPVQTYTTDPNAVAGTLPANRASTAPKATPTAKPKKAEAKPEADKKKAVTVDDLINDN